MSSLLPYFTTFYIFCSIIILNCHASLLQQSLYSKNWLGPSPDWTNPAMIDHSSYLIQSYHNICKRELIPLKLLKSNPVEAAKQLYYREDLVVLSHGLQDGVDGPILNYANIAAQKRWKGTWDQLTTLASTYTAEAQNREVRQKFMAKVLQDGYVDNYTGVRIAFDGSRFEIRNAVVWNLIVKGERIGQAASFSEWTDL